MEAAPFLGVILEISDSEKLPAAEQAEVKYHIVRCTAIHIGILKCNRKNIFGFAGAQEKVKIIMSSLMLWEGGGIYFLKGNVMFFHYSGVWDIHVVYCFMKS